MYRNQPHSGTVRPRAAGVASARLSKRGNSDFGARRKSINQEATLEALLEKILPVPPQQPAYRQNRTHEKFLTNLELPSHKIKEALKQSWSAGEEFKNIPVETIERLTRERYCRDEWNFKF
jgi:hypothetical protein